MEVLDSSEILRVLRRLSVRVVGGLYCWGFISGLEDQRVDEFDVEIEVDVLVTEARVVGFVDVVVGEVIVMSIEGRVLIDQDWSSLSIS